VLGLWRVKRHSGILAIDVLFAWIGQFQETARADSPPADTGFDQFGIGRAKLKTMRFPLALTAKIAAHIVKHKLLLTPKFAVVLQLEPLHTCNLTCTGCGRIREYSTSLKDMMSLEDCLGAASECDAPRFLFAVVSR
jgi:hypothetical protein